MNFKSRIRNPASLFFAALFFQLSWPMSSWALDPGKDISQFSCRTWSRQSGLPVNGINAITQSKDGYLWFGTSVGIVRFDGVEFKLVDLSSISEIRNGIVTSLYPARGGGLWVGLENSSFGFYDGQTFSFRGRDAWGQTDMYVHSIVESKDGTLWFAAERGAERLTPSNNFEDVLLVGSSTNESLNVLCGYEDLQGRQWFGTANQGVYFWQDGKITKLADTNLDEAGVLSIAEDLDGQIWVGTKQGLHCYDSHLQPKDIPPLWSEIRALLVDRQGVLWIGTSGDGLARYQRGDYEFLKKTDGLASDYVRALAEDQEGNLWVGTRDGVSQLAEVKFPIQPAAGDPTVKDALTVSASARGGVWMGSSKGASYFDPKTKSYTALTGLPNPYAKRIFESSAGNLYVVCGTQNLTVFSGGNAVANFVADSMVVGLAEDTQGVVVSVGPHLYRAGTNYFLPYVFNEGQSPDFYWIMNLITSRDGAIWVACGNGIWRVKDGDAQSFLPTKRVMWICEDDAGVIWAGSMTGIIRIKNGQTQFISRKQGLFDDNIYSIVPDNSGNLWVDSGRGIFRVTRKNMNDYADGKTNRVECTVYDGLEAVKTTDKTVQEHVGCKTLDGRIWFPSPKGVVVIDPAHILTNQIAPPVEIDSVRANGNGFPTRGRVIVPPGKGELEFRFNALSFIAPEKIHYRYQLVGYDKEWVDAAGRRLAFYTNLKPGHYSFHVIAANADGVWNETGDSVELELQPHFSQTGWFYFICVASGIAALTGIYAWRVRLFKRKQQALQKNRDLLEKEVHKRTAELAESNTSLQQEIEQHKETMIQLQLKTTSLEKEIEERERIQREIENVHRQLMDASRQAGMAEVASNVLHNVGNVLNSVNVSATLAADIARKSKVSSLAKVVDLLDQHEHDLGEFMGNNPKGQQLPGYLRRLYEHLAQEQKTSVVELESLRKHIEHIKDIVSMQQNYAKMSGLKEMVNVADLVEDSLRMNEGALERHEVELVREFEPVPTINVEKHKVLQILVNLIRNAKYACDEGNPKEKRLTVRIANGDGRIKISVRDNGVGIPPENLTRIFNHGFTTRKTGHGFGLHSGALAAKEMGGTLAVHSAGPGQGATFTIELPLKSMPSIG